MRVVFRRDAVFFESIDGIFFRSGPESFALKGASIYRDVVKLMPYLDGSVKLQGLLDSMPDTERLKITKLLNVLVARKCAEVVDADDEQHLDEATASQYRSQVEFLRHCADRPCSRFRRFRDSNVLLLGDGPVVRESALALLRNGLRRLVVHGATKTLRQLNNDWEAASKGPTDGILEAHDSTITPLFSEFDLVLMADGHRSFRDLHEINRQVCSQGGRLLAGYHLGNHTFVGPLVTRQKAPCWFCAVLRWVDNAEPRDAAATLQGFLCHVGRESTRGQLSGPVTTLWGNNLAFEAFRILTDVFPESNGAALVQDMATLESKRLTVMEHPQCPVCSSFSVERPQPTGNPLGIWTRLMDPLLGVFRRFDDASLVQVPLRVSAVEMRFANQNGAEPLRVLGWSDTTSEDARLDALKAALGIYALWGPARGLTVGRRKAAPASPKIVESRFVTSIECPADHSMTSDEIVIARDLMSAEEVEIPPAVIFPNGFRDNPATGEFPGLGVGLTLENALAIGLLSLLRGIGITQVLSGGGKLEPISALPTSCGEDASSHFNILARIGQPARLWMTTVYGAIPFVIGTIVANPKTVEDWEFAVGFSVSDAVDAALRRLCAQYQCAETGGLPRFYGVVSGAPLHVPQGERNPAVLDAKIWTIPEVAARVDQAGYSLYCADITPREVERTQTFRVARVVRARKSTFPQI